MRHFPRRLTAVGVMTTVFAALVTTPAFAHEGAPAGGVPTEDLIPAAIVGTFLVALVAVFE